MTTPTCNNCGQSEPKLEALIHPPTGDARRLCPPCLRAMARAKAAWSDERARARLVKAAKQEEQELWRSDHVLYLLPPMVEVKESTGRQNEPPTPAGER